MTAQITELQIALMTDDVTMLQSMYVEFRNVGFTGEPVEVK